MILRNIIEENEKFMYIYFLQVYATPHFGEINIEELKHFYPRKLNLNTDKKTDVSNGRKFESDHQKTVSALFPSTLSVME